MSNSFDARALAAKFPDKRESLLPMLFAAQDALGYIPRDALVEIAARLHMPLSNVYSVASFHDQIKLKPPGRFHIRVCLGVSCNINSSRRMLDTIQGELRIVAGDTTRDGLFSLETVPCLGACALAPAISINGECFSCSNPGDLLEYIRETRAAKGIASINQAKNKPVAADR